MSGLRELARRLGLSRHANDGTREGLQERLREALQDLLSEHHPAPGEVEIGGDEIKMLFNILKNGDLRTEEIMVPRVDVVAVDIEAPFAGIVQVFVEAAHSRLPLYRGTLDEVVGMVHVKDALRLMTQCETRQAEANITDIQRPVLFVSPSMRTMDLLTKMRASRVHMAIVVDEYGGTDGLVTIEDLVEQIVGDIEDEHDAGDPVMLRRLGDDKFDLDARLPIRELEEVVERDLSVENGDDVDTVGGLVFSLAGRVPRIGERIKHPAGVRFEVVDADPRRIARLRAFVGKTPAADNG